MKVLNLDKLSTGTLRKLVLKGVSYPISDMTVANFIETTQAAKRLEGASVDEQVEATVEMLLRSVPTISKEALIGQSLEVLQSIVEFVRGEEVDGAEEEAVGDDGKK